MRSIRGTSLEVELDVVLGSEVGTSRALIKWMYMYAPADFSDLPSSRGGVIVPLEPGRAEVPSVLQFEPKSSQGPGLGHSG